LPDFNVDLAKKWEENMNYQISPNPAGCTYQVNSIPRGEIRNQHFTAPTGEISNQVVSTLSVQPIDEYSQVL